MSSLTILRRPRRAVLHLARWRVTAATTAVGGGAIAAVVPWWLSEPWWVEAGLAAALLVGAVGAATDIVDRRIPDRVVLASLASTAAVLAVGLASGVAGTAVPNVLLGAATFAVPLLTVHLVSPPALGFGDVKLGAALGAALGLVDWRCSVVALCIASGLTASMALVCRRSTVPFAPGLVAGTALALVVFGGTPSWP